MSKYESSALIVNPEKLNTIKNKSLCEYRLTSSCQMHLYGVFTWSRDTWEQARI